MKGETLKKFSAQLDDDWKVLNEQHLEKEYKFGNFRQAWDFTNGVGELAKKIIIQTFFGLVKSKTQNMESQHQRPQRERL